MGRGRGKGRPLPPGICCKATRSATPGRAGGGRRASCEPGLQPRGQATRQLEHGVGISAWSTSVSWSFRSLTLRYDRFRPQKTCLRQPQNLFAAAQKLACDNPKTLLVATLRQPCGATAATVRQPRGDLAATLRQLFLARKTANKKKRQKSRKLAGCK